MIIDTHCHLNDERLTGEADRIVADFEKDGIESAICVGYDMPSSELAVKQAEKYDKVYAAIGIHPHDADKADYPAYERLSTLSSSKKVVAIGEIGLDYYYENTVRAIQQGAFREQLELASVLGLPVILHIRDAYEEARRILYECSRYLLNGVLLHCYSGSKEMVADFDKIDAYYAFGGAITFKNARRNVEALMAVPKDRLLFETDCPYMTPTPFRGKTNEPKYIKYVVEKAAEVLKTSVEELEDLTTKNTKTLFMRMK